MKKIILALLIVLVTGVNFAWAEESASAEEALPLEIQLLTKTAEAGDVRAQIDLGKAYYIGIFMEENQKHKYDHTQAIYWFTKAAEQEHPEAEYFLGQIYYWGDTSFNGGVEQDYEQSVYWFTKSAEQGYAESQHYLGWMYFDGEGVLKDNKTAYMWASLAIGNLDDSEKEAGCRELLEELEAEMTLEETWDAHNMAMDWLEQHEAEQIK